MSCFRAFPLLVPMAAIRLFVSLAIVSAMAQIAVGVNHQVGPSGTWQLGPNFQQWAASQTFTVGDNLVFQYSGLHDVLEVSKADYDSCQTTNPMQTHTGGNTVIPLTSPGHRYFICGTPAHCGGGMKLQVDTVAAAAASPSSSPSPPANSSATSSTTPPKSPSPSSSRGPKHAPAPAASPSPAPKQHSPPTTTSPSSAAPRPGIPSSTSLPPPPASPPQPSTPAAANMGGRDLELGILSLAVGTVAIILIA